MTGKEVCKAYADIVEAQSTLTSDWDEAMAYCLPYHNAEKTGMLINDSCGYRAARELASGIFSNTYTPDQYWFQLEGGDAVDDDDVVVRWLSAATKEMHRMLNASNFAATFHQGLLNGAANGNTLIFTGWRNGRIYHVPYTVPKCGYSVTAEDNLDVVTRAFDLTCRQAVDKWGVDKLPQDMQAEYAKNPMSGTKHCFIHAVIPRTNRDETMSDAKNQPFASYYVHKETGHMVEEGGYTSMPYALLRWYPTDGPYAIGPGVSALPDFRQLNLLLHDITNAVEMGIAPPVFIPSGSSKIKLVPGAVNEYDPMHGVPIFYETNFALPPALEREARLRQAIDDEFMLPMLYALLQRQGGTKTATEVEELTDEKILSIAPLVSRMHVGLLDNVLTRDLLLMIEHGQLPPPPEELLERGTPMIRYQSRLSARLNAVMARSTAQGIQEVAQMYLMSREVPELGDMLDLDRAAMDLLTSRNVSTDVLRTEGDAKKHRDQRLAMEQQRQQQEAMQQMVRPIDTQVAAEPGAPYDALRDTLDGPE